MIIIACIKRNQKNCNQLYRLTHHPNTLSVYKQLQHQCHPRSHHTLYHMFHQYISQLYPHNYLIHQPAEHHHVYKGLEDEKATKTLLNTDVYNSVQFTHKYILPQNIFKSEIQETKLYVNHLY